MSFRMPNISGFNMIKNVFGSKAAKPNAKDDPQELAEQQKPKDPKELQKMMISKLPPEPGKTPEDLKNSLPPIPKKNILNNR